MTHARLIPVLAAVLILSGCEKPAAPAAAPPAMTTPAGEGLALDLDTGGLIVVVADTGSTRPVAFGQAKAEALAMLNKAQGVVGKESVNAECGAGPLTFVAWPDGLTALFQDGKFAGWSVDERGAGTLAFMNGVGIGSTRAELAAQFAGTKVEETTLGVEFRLPDDSMTGGLLNGRDQAATITDLWAGVTCMFR
jgi:hypothetical protein